MTGAIDEAGLILAYVQEAPGTPVGSSLRVMGSPMYLRDMTKKTVGACAAFSLAGRVDLLLALVASVTCRSRALWVIALINLRVGVSKLDGDISDQFVLESNRLHTGDGLDHSRLAVGDMADGTNIDGGLPRNDLGCQGGQALDVEILGLGLRWQVRTLNWGRWCGLLEGRLEGLLLLVVRLLGVDLRLVAGVGLRLDVVAKLIAVGGHDEQIGRAGHEFFDPSSILTAGAGDKE